MGLTETSPHHYILQTQKMGATPRAHDKSVKSPNDTGNAALINSPLHQSTYHRIFVAVLSRKCDQQLAEYSSLYMEKNNLHALPNHLKEYRAH